jgi:hypothetical protein
VMTRYGKVFVYELNVFGILIQHLLE